MSIPYFGPDQNVVFVPALLVLLVATIVICLPIVFAPRLRRSSRRAPVLALAVVVAVVALVGAAMLAGEGFRTLGDERAAVRAWIAKTYDLRLSPGQVDELIDGGKPLKSLPSIANRSGLKNPDGRKTLELKPTVKGGDVYELYFAERPWPDA